jgi:hypothetical protein
VGRLDRLMDDGVQSDLDMQTLTQMQMADDVHAMRHGSSYGGRRSSGTKGHGIIFWIILIVMTYWFLLKPLGLTLTRNW